MANRPGQRRRNPAGAVLVAVGFVLAVLGGAALTGSPDAAPPLIVGGILLTVVGWTTRGGTTAPARSTRRAEGRRTTDGRAEPGADARGAEPAYLPARPVGDPLEPWTAPVGRVEVVGEADRPEAFRRLLHGLPLQSPEGAELAAPAALAPDPTNPEDPNAVAVWIAGEHVGYLARATAAFWHPRLAELASDGSHLLVPALTRATDRADRLSARVTLQLPEPTGLRPANPLPTAPHVVLPGGSTLQVTKQDAHQDALADYATGPDVPVAVTLHVVRADGARSRPVIEVRIDGERVGELSRYQSDNLLPLVTRVEGQGTVPVARAVVRGNRLKADVVLYAAKAQDLDPAWLEGLAPPAGT